MISAHGFAPWPVTRQARAASNHGAAGVEELTDSREPRRDALD